MCERSFLAPEIQRPPPRLLLLDFFDPVGLLAVCGL